MVAPQTRERQLAPSLDTWPGSGPAIEAITRSLASSATAIVVVGSAASGARDLVDLAIRGCGLPPVANGGPVREVPGRQRCSEATIAGSLDEIATALAIQASPMTPLSSLSPLSPVTGEEAGTRWVERLARAARCSRAPVVVELGEDPRTRALIRALTRADGGNPVIAIVDRDPGTAGRCGVVQHVAPVLDGDGVAALAAAMLGAAPPRAWAAALLVATGGQVLSVIDLVRSIAGEQQPFAIDWTVRTAGGLAELRARQLRAAPVGARRVAAAVAAWGGRVAVDRVLATLYADGRAPASLADVAELEHRGLLRRRGDQLSLDPSTADAVGAAGGGEAIARLATAALRDLSWRRERSPLDREPHAGARPGSTAVQIAPPLERAELERERVASRGLTAVQIAPLLERAELDRDRAALACEVAEDLLARGRADRALALARRALAIDPAGAGLVAARAAEAADLADQAAAYARDAEAAGADPVRARLIIARAAERAGALDVAGGVLAAVHAAHPRHDECAAAYARVLVALGHPGEARAIAMAAGPLGGSRAEAAGLATLALGDLDAADAAFAVLEVGAAASGDDAVIGRALALRGTVAQRRGQLGLACERHREAARRLDLACALPDAAIAELDLAAVLVERGRASEALPRLAIAARLLADLDASAASCATDICRCAALLLVGQIDEARAAADAALARAGGAPEPRTRALIIAGDVRRRLADEAGALRRYREALAIADGRGDPGGRLGACIALAEVGQRAGTGTGTGTEIDALCATESDRDRWTLARGRLALRDPSSLAAHAAHATGSLGDATATLARACAEVAVRASDADRLERAFRGHAIAAQLALRARDPDLAAREAERARVAHATWTAATAPAFRAALDGDPDLARLPGDVPARLAPGWRDDADAAALRRLLALSRRLHTETSIERILDDVIDTAIELSCAERGFVLIRQPAGDLAVVVARNFFPGALEPGSGHGSSSPASPGRSIAERVARTGEPVVTIDAALDDRPGGTTSALAPRSVLAVPLRQRGAVTGCLYVDHRLRGGALDAAHAVLGELADLAAIAVENARRTSEALRAAHDADERSARLRGDLAERDAELARLAGRRDRAPEPVPGEDLRLRPVVSATERAYIAAAMARAGNNQTIAARLLGLSRFGLQKKLRRLADDDAAMR